MNGVVKDLEAQRQFLQKQMKFNEEEIVRLNQTLAGLENRVALDIKRILEINQAIKILENNQ